MSDYDSDSAGRVVKKRARDDGEGGASDDEFGDMLALDSVQEVTTLSRSPQLMDLLTKIETTDMNKNTITPSDPEYAVLEDTNKMVVEIEREKIKVFRFVRDHYRHRFPELESLIVDTVLFTQIVKLIANNVEDLTPVIDKLHEMLPSQVCAVIIVTASVTRGICFESADMDRVIEACDEMETLEQAKQILLEYVQSRMLHVAPNLSMFLGAAIAAQLFGICGSLAKLAEMAPTDLAQLGASKRNTAGFSANVGGFLLNCDLIRSQPAEVRHKALRVVSNKVSLAARVDAHRHAADGSRGVQLREHVRAIMEGWQQPMMTRAVGGMYDRRARVRRSDLAARKRQERGF
eukprot:PhM_4_TR19072/c0_g1_i1/m.91966/K12844/PRPF31; U4/U6 small nuclear ribonucleoprotein PRP31